MTPGRHCQPWHGVLIVGVRSHCIPPPVEGGVRVAEGEEDHNGGDGRTGVHGCLEEVYYVISLEHLLSFHRCTGNTHSCTSSTKPRHVCE